MFEISVLLVWIIIGIEILWLLYTVNIIQDTHNEWPSFKNEVNIFVIAVWPIFMITLVGGVIYGLLKNYKSLCRSSFIIIKYKLQEMRDTYANRF